MFAVIQTGGKQYRVQAGDLLVVEKLDGRPGDELSFDQVLMMGEGDQITVGAPTVAGGVVRAVLVETRKGEKIKVFKKIRRQGYRRTGGHRQIESVLRVVGLEGDGRRANWEGKVDLTPRSELVARSRGLASWATPATGGDVTPPAVHVDPVVIDETPGPVHHVAVVEHADPAPVEAAPKKSRAKKAEAAPEAAPQEAAPAKKPRAKKAAADEGALVEPPTSELAADAPQTVATTTDDTGAQAGSGTAPKKPRAKKTSAPEGDA
jgi:large subunit ribosomal protein L21